MDVSIIYVNYNTSDLLMDSVASLVDWTRGCSYEIIIVDNASTSEEQEKLKSISRQFPSAASQIIYSKTNLGFGKANNLGAQYASGDYLFLLNPDTILVTDAVSALYKAFQSDYQLGVAGGLLLDTHSNPSGSCGEAFDSVEAEKKMHSFTQTVKKFLNRKKGMDNSSAPTPVITSPAYVFGADLMIPTYLFQTIQGFDPDFFMYGEEQEMQYRIMQQNRTVRLIPEAKIIHIDGGSFDQKPVFNPNQFRMRMEGKYLFFKKVYGEKAAQEFLNIRARAYRRNQWMTKLLGRKETAALYQTQLQIMEELKGEKNG